MKSTEQIKSFREMKEPELQEHYNELMKELFNLRFQTATAQLSSPGRFKQVKREIARIKTAASEREITLG
jgi:large subunit ribosomal protein L29